MMREYTTGNRIVDASAEISITGNITPQAWYKTIVKETGKPHLAAIVILSDIVYWYRPTELRDESTGQIVKNLKLIYSREVINRLRNSLD